MPSREFLAFVDRCQVAVGTLRWDQAVTSVLSETPDLQNLTEQLVLEGLVARLREAMTARTRVTAAPPGAAGPTRHARLARLALEWIDAHHTEPFSGARLASAVGVSRCHLARVLTQQTRHGVRWHVAEARTTHAERLIRDTPLSLKEIASRAGFRSASELSRQFQRRRGVAPSALRPR